MLQNLVHTCMGIKLSAFDWNTSKQVQLVLQALHGVHASFSLDQVLHTGIRQFADLYSAT